MGVRALSHNRGAAYLWVITLTMVVMLLSAMFLAMTATDRRITDSFSDGIRAYYLADSGAEKQYAELHQAIMAAPDFDRLPQNPLSPAVSSGFSQYSRDNGYSIQGLQSSRPPGGGQKMVYQYKSVGYYGKAKRIIAVSFEVTVTDIPGGGHDIQIEVINWNTVTN